MRRGQLGVDGLVGLSELERIEPAVRFRKLLLDDVRLDRHA